MKNRIRVLKMYLIFDSNQLCYSAYFAMGHLAHEDEGTGVIYGFLQQVYTITNYFKKQKPVLIFAWDSRHSLRQQHYSNYKRKRKERKETEGPTHIHYKQFKLLRMDILPSIGFNNNFMQVGYEADDIIGAICNKYQNKRKVIISSDQDLYQLLDIHTSMFKYKQKKLYTNDDLFKEYGLQKASDWIDIKALAGCSTDEVNGIKGVGEKTAVQYFYNKMKTESKKYQTIKTFRNQMKYRRNIPLVTVPYPRGDMEEIKIKKNNPMYDDFYAMCLEYNFKSMIKDMAKWVKVLKLT